MVAGAPASLALVVLAVLGAVAGTVWPKRAAGLAAAFAGVGAVLFALAWANGDRAIVDAPWLSVIGARFVLQIDALAGPLCVFVLGLAAAIMVYTAGYLPHHLHARGREQAENGRFALLMIAFTTGMVLLLVAQDLLVLFLALEITAVLSFLLIAFDRDEAAARRAGLGALVVTAGTSLLFLVGTLMLAAGAGTTSVAGLQRWFAGGGEAPLAVALLATGVLAKSAQVPLHFWLPRAMVAPTPVSAYLHSATLVAAGVFVLQRLWFAVSTVPEVVDGLLCIGFASILVGSAMALVADELKRLLAYSTIAQYGHVIVLLALGGDAGAVGAPLFLIAHGICKCGLFLVAGAVTSATGANRLSEVGGLARRAPVLAVAAAVLAAGLAGLPATIGWFKDELFFGAAAEHGAVVVALATSSVVLTLAYASRFWLGVFAGAADRGGDRARGFERLLVGPIVALALATVAGGFLGVPLAGVLEPAGAVVAGEEVRVELGYHLDLRTENVMTLSAWALAILLVLTRDRWTPSLAAALRSTTRWVGPAAWSDRLVAGVAHASTALDRIEARDLRDRLGAVIVPTALLIVGGVVAGRTRLDFGRMTADDVPLVAALLVVALASMIAAQPLQHAAVVLLLSVVGFGMALVFAFSGAPNVALVAVIVEILLTLLFMALLSRIRHAQLRRAEQESVRTRRLWVALVAGAVSLAVTWSALSVKGTEPLGIEHVMRADEAHAKDVVTAVVADFRGLDTAGELTVLAIAILGAGTIRWRRKP